ncbi:MAG: ABC transporter ATP-binding protein [Planctomycetales bacterium]|nr:ABC transporter ATP-binding protein [Planctomycetales bacterium]
MNNFLRVLRISLNHRFTLAASVLCSLAVAVIWGGNITAIAPIVDVVMVGKSVPQWLDDEIETKRAEIAELAPSIATAKDAVKAAPPGDSAEEQRLLARLTDREAFLRSKLAIYERFSPWAHRVLPSTAFKTLVVICAALVLGTLLKTAFRVIGSYASSRLGALTGFDLRKEFYRRTLRLDLGTFRETSPGDLMTRFTHDVNIASVGVANVWGTVLREPLKALVCLAGAAWVSWRLFLITAFIAPVAGYLIHWLAKSLKRANRRALAELSNVYDRLEETFSGIKVIKAFTGESRERSRFHRDGKLLYRRTMRIAFYDSLVSPMTELLGIAVIVVVVIAGGYLVLNGQTHLFKVRISHEPLTHGTLTLFYGLLAGASDPMRRMTGVFNTVQQGIAASDRIYELMDRQSLLVEAERPVRLPAPLGRIEFSDVSFAYKANEPVLQQVSLVIEPGETVAIVGPNGCGKSTLMNLLPRFYDPTHGTVSISGVDLRDARLRDLRARIGVVTQETLLFDDTVATNILYGRPEATFDEVREAARRAHAERFIEDKLTDGYASLCGPAGNRLSGGQRQRIALARAILRDPEILILDEATSQIDVESERLIHEVLQDFIQGRTAVMITHRPSTLELADRVVVMDQGRIVDSGTFAELAGRCELFRRLVHLDLRESA